MNHTRNAPILWDRVALLVVILIIFGGVIWWLETRFGAGIAILILGGLAFITAYTVGNFAGRRDTITTVRETMTAMSDHVHEISKPLEIKAKAQGQIVQGENRILNQAERDAARYTQRLASQQAKLLNAPAQPNDNDWYQQFQQPTVDTTKPADNDGFTVYE